MNFSKPEPGAPALLGFDDARTLFHEFGHALHGLLSDVTYPYLSGTSVDRDFVEFPSQLFEHWLEEPDDPRALRPPPRHRRAHAPKPSSSELKAARNADQGFATVEYTACALVDLDLHLLEDAETLDVGAFERESLARIGMPDAIVMRHRPPHFAHVFSGGGYASGYYSYMWSEVLDADGFVAFEETGDPFDPALAKLLQRPRLRRRQPPGPGPRPTAPSAAAIRHQKRCCRSAGLARLTERKMLAGDLLDLSDARSRQKRD